MHRCSLGPKGQGQIRAGPLASGQAAAGVQAGVRAVQAAVAHAGTQLSSSASHHRRSRALQWKNEKVELGKMFYGKG